MTRFLAGLGLAAPIAIALLAVALAIEALVPSAGGSGISTLLAMMVGAAVTAAIATAWLRGRLIPVVKAAERLAGGELQVRLPRHVRGIEGRLAAAIRELAVDLVETRDAATTDKLTGIANRPAVLAALFTEVERSVRYGRPLSVAFLDVDLFKAVNDTYGHAAGDVVLRGIAGVIAGNLRATDVVGRYGGEEFMLILPETTVDSAAVLAEKLRTRVLHEKWDVAPETSVGVTVSIGVAGGIGPALSVDALVRDVDAAMYSAKSLGRNQVYLFSEPNDDATVPRAPISIERQAIANELGREARHAAERTLVAQLTPLADHRGQASALIATIAVALGRRLDLPAAELDRLRLAALLHDVGKLALPEEILEKPSALTAAEWRIVIQHPRIAQVILEQASAIRDAVPIVLYHHERFAGHGYPHGLHGVEIPIGARILAIADAYDAMIHERPYKRAMPHAEAVRELARHAGTQFDPDLTELFLELYTTEAPQADERLRSLSGAIAEPRPHVARRRAS